MINQKAVDAAREALRVADINAAMGFTHGPESRDLANFISAVEAAMKAEPPSDGMCPNCVTPWKCNGPHEFPAKEPAK